MKLILENFNAVLVAYDIILNDCNLKKVSNLTYYKLFFFQCHHESRFIGRKWIPPLLTIFFQCKSTIAIMTSVKDCKESSKMKLNASVTYTTFQNEKEIKANKIHVKLITRIYRHICIYVPFLFFWLYITKCKFTINLRNIHTQTEQKVSTSAPWLGAAPFHRFVVSLCCLTMTLLDQLDQKDFSIKRKSLRRHFLVYDWA